MYDTEEGLVLGFMGLEHLPPYEVVFQYLCIFRNYTVPRV